MTADPIMPEAQQPAPPASLDPPPRRPGRGWMIVAGLAFVLGVAAVIAALPLIDRWRSPSVATPTTASAQAPAGTAAPVAATAITLEGLAAREAAIDTQLRAVEARLALADASSRTSAANATRAERLLIATAARRELNRGLPLGYLEAQLRAHFPEQGRAVGTVIAAARQPTTIEDLRQALDRLAPQLASGSGRESVWTAVRRELGDLVVLRRDSSPSPRPSDRLERARRMIDAGNVEGALAEVKLMPGAAGAASWIAAAQRFADARRALNVLEMAALDGSAPPPVPPAPSPAPAPAPAQVPSAAIPTT